MNQPIVRFSIMILTAFGLNFCGWGYALAVPKVAVNIPHIEATIGQPTVTLTISLQNFGPDEITALQFGLTFTDTTLASINFESGSFDTSGTLLSGWELITGIDREDDGNFYLFSAFSDLPFNPAHRPGIQPGENGDLVRINIAPALLPELDGNLVTEIVTFQPVQFVNQNSEPIGFVVDTTVDTVYFECDFWLEDFCFSWSEVTGPPFDSVRYDTTVSEYTDTTAVTFAVGSLTLHHLNCDVNADAEVDVADVVCLVEYAVVTGSGEPCAYVVSGCDANRDGGHSDVADLVYLVEYMFNDGPPPLL